MSSRDGRGRRPSVLGPQAVKDAVARARGDGAPRPGWYPDPAGVGDTRYWDGASWTERVTRAGDVSASPIANQPAPPDRGVNRGFWGWARFAILVPSRLVILVIMTLSIAVAAAIPDAADQGGVVGALMFIGGICIITVLLGWRWFWSGTAVVKKRLERDPAFRRLVGTD